MSYELLSVSSKDIWVNMEILKITWKLLNLILSPCEDINKTNSRCNPAINMFYKHILHQHVDQHNQSRNPPVIQLKRREEVIWSESCALWPKCYSEMNLWVTLSLIFVYLPVHFKIDSDRCLSLDIQYTSLGVLDVWDFQFYSFLSPFHLFLFFSCSFSLQFSFLRFSCFNLYVFAVHLLASSRFLQPDYASDTGKPLM